MLLLVGNTMIDTLIKRCLASCVKYPERPKTKGDILRYALYVYLNGEHIGLCHAIRYAMKHYNYKYDVIVGSFSKISEIFPLFEKNVAIRLFNGKDWAYWWPLEDYKNRYRYMRWLIKEYDNIKL